MTLDRCPGVLRPHQAADGAMVRIRIPGGQTTGSALRRLGQLAAEYGSGLLQLTSRASLQVRGLPELLPQSFERAVAAAGFLPSASHERVRNVVASSLTGLSGGVADLRPMVHDLDRALTAQPALAGLSGRFLFGLDDGRGDITGLEPDLSYHASTENHGAVLVGSRHALPVTAAEAVGTLVALARAFQIAREETGAWRVRDLPGWAPSLPGLRSDSAAGSSATGPSATGRYVVPLGAVGVHASVHVPLGLLTPDQLRTVCAAAGNAAVVLTPWRSLIVEGGAGHLAALTDSGLITDDSSPWTAISACVGAPWCAHGRVDTQALVRSVANLDATWPRTHVSGCERRCGAPSQDHHDLVAPTRDQLFAIAGLELSRA